MYNTNSASNTLIGKSFLTKTLYIISVFTLIVLLTISCSSNDTQSSDSFTDNTSLESRDQFGINSETIISLTAYDSIGVELGDANYVFGAISEAKTGPNGNIYVLDRMKCTIFKYSPEGEFIQRIGREGNAPGELLQSYFFAVMDDRSISLHDAENGWIRFDSTGECVNSGIMIIPRPFPLQFMALDSVNILGMINELGRDDNALLTTQRICLWNANSPEPIIAEYFSKEYSIEIGENYQLNMRDLVEIDYFPILFTAGNDFVCIAPEPRTEPVLYLYHKDSSVVDTLVLPYPEVVRTEAELSARKQYVEELFYATTNRNQTVEWEPFGNKPMILSLGVDSLNRIWVQRGFEVEPTFDLYDASGTHLATAVLSGRNDTFHWIFHISRHGILAIPEDPESFYSVYLIQFQNNDR